MWHTLSSSALKHVYMLMRTQLRSANMPEGRAKIAKQPQLQITKYQIMME